MTGATWWSDGPLLVTCTAIMIATLLPSRIDRMSKFSATFSGLSMLLIIASILIRHGAIR